MRFVSCQCSVKYSLSVLKCTLTTSYGLVFLCSSPYLVNQSGLFGFETNEPNPSMCAVGATTQLNAWPRLCRAKSTLFFANSFGTLDHFKVDCEAEESTRGQQLVIMMMDTSLEKDSRALNVLRVYYEPPTLSTSEVELLSLYAFFLISTTSKQHSTPRQPSEIYYQNQRTPYQRKTGTMLYTN